jgi:hypothetical protein
VELTTLFILSFNSLHENFVREDFFVYISSFGGHSDSLPKHPGHAFCLYISFEHGIYFRLGNNILYFVKKIFSHRAVEPIKTLYGLNVCGDQLIEQVSSQISLMEEMLKLEHAINLFLLDMSCWL